MKKSIFAIGLLSLVMILTSFTTTETKVCVNNINTTLQAAGSGSAGGGKILDASGSGSAGGGKILDASGSGSAGGGKILDASGSGSAGGGKILD